MAIVSEQDIVHVKWLEGTQLSGDGLPLRFCPHCGNTVRDFGVEGSVPCKTPGCSGVMITNKDGRVRWSGMMPGGRSGRSPATNQRGG
jgi:hypothetical protein